MNTQHPAFLAVFLLALTACDGTVADPATADVVAANDDTGFRAEHAQWVQGRAEELSKPDGWTSLIGLHWVEAGKQGVGSGEGNDIRLAIGPDTLGEVELRDGLLYFRIAPGVALTIDGQPLQGEAELKPEGRGGGTQLAYDEGKGRISVVNRADRLALRVRHADAPGRLGFKGLDFFPVDEDWKVQARFIAHPPGRTLPIVNLIGNVSDSPNPGYLEFEKDGRTWHLEALGDPARGLNLMFQDQTSGQQTYAVGRYLRTSAVAQDGTATLDFNRAYNPPCAYTDYATCPLPPPENRFVQKDDNGERVRLAVLAGEKSYAAAH